MSKWIAIIVAAFMFLACEDGDKPEDGTSYELAVGDTLITIPAEAVRFAAEHFEWHAYMLREYQIAINPSIPRNGGSPYSGELIDWKNASWSLRSTFLVPPYAHNLDTNQLELYYYLIGTHPDQFGFGWMDTYDPEADLWNSALRPWLNPADSTLTPDNPSTLEFDGGLGDMLEYRGMWSFN